MCSWATFTKTHICSTRARTQRVSPGLKAVAARLHRARSKSVDRTTNGQRSHTAAALLRLLQVPLLSRAMGRRAWWGRPLVCERWGGCKPTVCRTVILSGRPGKPNDGSDSCHVPFFIFYTIASFPLLLFFCGGFDLCGLVTHLSDPYQQSIQYVFFTRRLY